MKINIPSHLSDSGLVSETKRLARNEREATAQLVAHIAELDARRIHLAAGFTSLFAYCREVLGLSEQSTYNRTQAAHAARSYPVILEMLSEAALTLATVRLLAPHLTPENYEGLLKSAAHRSKREVELLVARHFPQPAVPDSVRKLRERSSAGSVMSTQASAIPPVPKRPPTESLMAGADGGASRPERSTAVQAAALMVPPPAAPPRPTVRPLAEDRYEIRFTAPESTCEKLRLAQDMLRHAVPSGDIAAVIDRALTALLEDVARRKYAATDRPRRAAVGTTATRTTAARTTAAPASDDAPPASASRHIPAAVRRTVWLRDEGRCRFVSAAGRRCDTRGFLEFHHVEPFAAGGPPTSENIHLRCRAHNSYEAQLYFDPASLDGGTCPGAS